MKRLIASLTTLALVAIATASLAGDYHVAGSLFCEQCHIAHASQQHAYSTTGTYIPFDDNAGQGHGYLLRNEPNLMCLACHDNNSLAPDVFGVNTGSSPTDVRQAGALNSGDALKLANDGGYADIDGHTLWSAADPPGKGTSTYTPPADGLECISCHAQHGGPGYRNLLHRSLFAGDTLTYVTGANNTDYWVYQRSAKAYDVADVDFNEPDPTQSRYGVWCENCHQVFHGQGGAANMGGQSGGYAGSGSPAWRRHPTSDVNLGHTGQPSHVASLAAYQAKTYKVKMMSTSGNWTPAGSTSDLTPSCFSCHKAHGNKNAFGLIWMQGSTGPVSEEGDGTLYKDLCKQCHSQG